MDNAIQIGKVEGVFYTPDPESFITASQSKVAFALGGIPGDRHFGHSMISGGREKKVYPRGTEIHNNRQWSAVSVEELKTIAHAMQLEMVLPEWVGANLLLSGIPNLSSVAALTRLKFFSGDKMTVVLMVYGQNRPCIYPHQAMEKALGKTIEVPFTKAAATCRGLVGWVEKPGIIQPGDTFICEKA